uniref:Ig-like domain-containing protein n=1 Tax=Sander lucioperca TaxID=283035 RepID=A0A8C9X6Z6_SANLU
LIYLLCMVSFSPECKGEDRVIQPTDVITTEGETVTLGCTFETTRASPNLLWYKQEVNDFPKYMLQRFSEPQFILWKGATTGEYIPDKRYESKTSVKTTELTIKRLTLADTGLYYCTTQYFNIFYDVESLYLRSVTRRFFVNIQNIISYCISLTYLFI